MPEEEIASLCRELSAARLGIVAEDVPGESLDL